MIRKNKQIVKQILGFILLCAIIYGVWMLALKFVDAISKASPEVTAAIIGAMATVFGGIAIVLITQRDSRFQAAEEAHRLRKVDIYKSFIEVASKMIASSNKKLSIKEPTQDELIKFAFRFKSDILLWGSPSVIKSYIAFEDATQDNAEILSAVNALYAAIRSDIGLSNRGLNNHELVKIFITDRKELDKIV
jgi:hypothetical protein